MVPASPGFIDLGGVVRLGSLRWAAEVQGLPGEAVDLPMHRNGRIVGRFILTPEPGHRVLPDRLMTAAALADLVAGATRETPSDAPSRAFAPNPQTHTPEEHPHG
jgi:hypothetical protein